MPHVAANCILFPAWLESHAIDEIREELLRLMTVGRAFRSFSFTILEIDQKLAGQRIFEFYDLFRQCASPSYAVARGGSLAVKELRPVLGQSLHYI
jgi:hypothetical protein